MKQLWYLFLFQPIVNGLIVLYQVLFRNLGLAIIALTIIIRLLLLPLTLSSIKTTQRIKELSPEINKLREKYRKDQQAFIKAQMELYRRHGANPTAGCLPQILQLIVLIALYQAFVLFLRPDGNVIQQLNQVLYFPLRLSSETKINTQFLYLDLTKPDVYRLPIANLQLPLPGLFLTASAILQFFSSKMMSSMTTVAKEEVARTQKKTDDLAVVVQSQMTYLFPLMTILIGYSFPSGLILYWFVFSLLMIVQQYLINDWGELRLWIRKIKVKK